MLRILKSYELERLAARLQKERGDRQPEDPLDPELIIVQNHGMARWLTLRLAEMEGIAANLSFEFPAERVWATARRLYPEIPDLLPSERGPMAWELYGLLGWEDHPVLEPLHDYVEAGKGSRPELRRWKLGRRIADVFDQYLVYRPGMLRQWEAGERAGSLPAERWQAWLWKALVERWEERVGDKPWIHRARLHADLEEAIDGGRLTAEHLPEHISVFGVTAMPPAVAQLLGRCAELCDVTFYQCYSGGANHPLARSWGNSGREFMELLEGYDADSAESLDSAGDQQDQETLLRSLQQAVRDEGQVQREWDDSLQVHSCHSALREVQVLHDRILAMLEEDPELGPGDILVVNPDMEQYAPLIDSVFGITEADLPELPYQIVDSTGADAPAGKAFHTLLELTGSRFKASDVLDFLELEAVRDRFGFTDDQLDRIEHWVEENRIRWGIDEAFKREMELPATAGNTWAGGLSRMMLGYAMEPAGQELYDGIPPYGKIGQSDDVLLLGTLSELLHRLFDLHRFARTDRTPGAWAGRLRGELRYFVEDGEPHTRSWFRLSGLLDRLASQGEAAGFDGPAAFSLVADWLKGELGGVAPSGGGSPSGSITFGSMISLRNIPFKVICLTGMSDGAFPRSAPAPAFDLIRAEPRAGDRSRLEEDRQIMLEALNSAREKIYVSYVGQSNRQETEYPPSVVVSELLDSAGGVSGLNYDDAAKRVFKHPLQPFSPAYFGKTRGDGGRRDELFSYSSHYRGIAARLGEGNGSEKPFFPEPLPAEESPEEPLTLGSLVDFARNPSRHLLQHRLGLYLDERLREEENREPFEMDHLERFLIGQELVDRAIEGADTEGSYTYYRASDRLPGGWPGREAFRQLNANVEEFVDQLDTHVDADELEPVSVEVSTSGGEIRGLIDRLYKDGMVFYRFGRRKAGDLAEIWIRHLALQFAGDGTPRISRMFNRNSGGETEHCLFPEIPRAKASDHLAALVSWYRKGMREPQPFFPETSFRFAEQRLRSENGQEAALKKARKEWLDEHNPYPLEGDNPYNRRVWHHADPLETEGFRKLAIDFWKPVLEHMEEDL